MIDNNQKSKTMFTVEQIRLAHSKVKSGADFPSYIREMKSLGVTYYETFLTDGHSVYHGRNHFELATQPKFETVPIPDKANEAQLKADIANHQQGKSNYEEIVRQCAHNGVEKWAICMDSMTCTYYNKSGNKILVEQIPQ
jgi:uncharacterized protein YbcV (DUF1398 family)